ncbi:glycogen debranching protein [Tessaracoccus sp. MC1865]|uniref:MGH1-like glycoside hydrolase domain-containing protein n=1 Tax=Tessaracoccus sp. MC1865 TaxID=2760310 RepID=UPI0016044FA7|nr:glycogen debranching protein [Tessaracoccus sp. MC1865]MBB1484249.1 glycogen debranching protein [Tessaracoccus sp. MC1865]QTO37266.1 hypothetical protein J7D54_12670 [Tessaracoccus sp. MC1865]
MQDLGPDLAHWFDLDHVPYTVRGSRLFVRRSDDGLTVYRAAYERPLADSIAVRGLRVLDGEGSPADVELVDPWRITFTGGAHLYVTADDEVVVELPPRFRVEGAVNRAETTLRIAGAPEDGPSQVAAELGRWMAKCPTVDERWRDITRFCWWVLGANTLTLDAPEGLSRAVVPSKIGYVGLWQWDAYFMAIGLRHGDIGLATEQLRIALAYPCDDGQLPDVVHEDGILASSDDLPPGDLKNLRRMGSPSLAHSRVPLTKPPLTALAVALLAEQAGPAVIDEFLPTMLAAQEWWYSTSAPAGHPAYLHPYSSGLDDSPIFDDDAILVSPDLTSYLILADRLLADWLEERGEAAAAERCRSRADRSVAALAGTWDESRAFFPSIGEHGDPVASETIVSLMPVLVEGLPERLLDALLAAINDPQRFATAHPLPTVAVRDDDFSPTRMWRGPVWVNTNWLVATGLRARGRDAEAERIERATVELVAEHGPNEYFRPDTGAKPPRATTVFGWSAALTVDLAVRLSGHI